MNPYQILELILEALADGRQEGESIKDFKKRKADELEKHFRDQAHLYRQGEAIAAQRAKEAKAQYEENPNSETGQQMVDSAINALDKAQKTTNVERKEYNARRIKNKMSNEALEILEDIYSAINKRYPKNSERNKELKDSAYKSKTGAEEVAKEHELGKRPESAPIKGGWDIRTWEIPAETPEEREYSKKETDYDIKQIRKEFTKNKTGEHETKKKQFPKAYKDVGVLGEPDSKELETERTARKALGKRKVKMNKNEAFEIMEEIINVVEGRKEGEATEDMKNRLHKELVLAVDKRAAEAREKGDHKEWEKQHKKLGKLDDIQPVYNAYVRAENDKIKEALSLMEQICDFADNLFELDYEEKQNISPNKIFRTKKDKDGEKVEVVSVADELFPYSGSAKEQFNQKVLAKINDMIEGTGSLEDLIQFVRKGVPTKKKVNEAFDEAVDLLENIYTQIQKVHGEDEYNPMNKSAKLMKKASDTYNKEVDDASRREGKNVREKRLTSKAHKDEWVRYHGGQWSKKADGYEGVHDEGATEKSIKRHGKKSAHESLDEGKEPNAECEYRKGEWDKAVQNYYDTKKKNMDFEGKHPETKKAYDEERKAYANLDKARRDSKKINGPYEALEEIKNVAEGLFKKDERGDLLDDIDTALGSPVKKKLADIKAKMTGCKETKVHEDIMNLVKELLNESNPEAIQKVANKRAYDAGYHSQKQFNDGEVTPEGKRAQKKFAKIKELIRKREDRTGDWAVKHSELADNCNKGWEDSKKVHEALDLMEEIINEVSLGKWVGTAQQVLPNREEKEKISSSRETKAKSRLENAESKKKYPNVVKHLEKEYADAYVDWQKNTGKAEHARKVDAIGSGVSKEQKENTQANDFIKKVVKADSRDKESGLINKEAKKHGYRASDLLVSTTDPVKNRNKDKGILNQVRNLK